MDIFNTDKLNDFFYEGLGRQSSVYLYGSAATGNWVPGRSDLDLIILVPEDKLSLVGQKVRDWSWSSNINDPILDGYAVSKTQSGLSIKRLDELMRVNFPSDARIDLVDQWMIKNRSKLLFGEDSLSSVFPNISVDQLSAWAKETLRVLLKSNPKGIMPNSQVVLSKLIWSVSWSARMLMLSRGIVCESKREALQWLGTEYPSIRKEIQLLMDDYLKTDLEPVQISSEQSMMLCKFCFELMLVEGNS